MSRCCSNDRISPGRSLLAGGSSSTLSRGAARDTADDVCHELRARDGCFDFLLQQLLQQELQYFNARDGKDLTWQQRPLRFLSEAAAAEYTLGHAAELLDVYRDDSQTQYYRPYDAASINVLIERARHRLPGTNYRDIDALLYQALADGHVHVLAGARVAVVGSVMPWLVACWCVTCC